VEDRYACFEAGMDGFLIKPLDREKLADALRASPPRGISRLKLCTIKFLRNGIPRLNVSCRSLIFKELQPPQRHRFDHVIGALLEDQRRARPRRQDIFLEIGEVGALPDRQRGCGGFLVDSGA
jgi:DNA-binding response OmpR family regulator